MREERDKEIDLAIQRLEADNSMAVEELDKRYRSKMIDQQDKFDIEKENVIRAIL